MYASKSHERAARADCDVSPDSREADAEVGRRNAVQTAAILRPPVQAKAGTEQAAMTAALEEEDEEAHEDAAEEVAAEEDEDAEEEEEVVQAKGAVDAGAGVDLAHDGGAPLPASVCTQMEDAFGSDFGGVRVHSNPAVAKLGARALAQGEHVHLAPGTDVNAPAGRELLGHELAHVQQQRAGRVATPQAKGGAVHKDDALEAEADAAGAQAARGERVTGPAAGVGAASARADAVAQPKLAGSAEVLESRGAKVSKSGKSHRSSWYKLVKDVRAYEQKEDRLVRFLRNAMGNPGPVVEEEGAPMVHQLHRIEQRMELWITEHGRVIEKGDQAVEKETLFDRSRLTLHSGRKLKHKQKKENSVIRRAEAIRMLLPRVRVERRDLGDTLRSVEEGRFPDQPGRFAENLVVYHDRNVDEHRDNAVGDQMNKLDWMRMGGKEGYFAHSQARGTYRAPLTDLGVNKNEYNNAGRAVAMYRLARLLGLGERIVQTEFATHRRVDLEGNTTTESGIFMERAKGEEMRDVARRGEVSLSSPLIQVAANQLHLLDLLCAQVDRHGGNYFYDPESGEIKGIDLDQSFGSEVTTLLGGSRDAPAPLVEGGTGKLKGLPTLVDRELAQTLVELDPQLVRDALTGLLDEAEITATVQRLAEIKAHLAKPEVRKLARHEWDQDTAIEQLSTAQSSYLETIALDTSDGMIAYQALIEPRGRWDQLKDNALLPLLIQQGRVQVHRLPEFIAEVDEIAGPRLRALDDQRMDTNKKILGENQVYADVVKQVAQSWGIL